MFPWREHFSLGDPEVAERFNGLQAADVRPWLQARGVVVTDAPPVDHESWENRVFSFETPEGRLVLKVFRPGRWSLDALRDEATFLRDLEAASVPVSRLFPMPDGVDVAVQDGLAWMAYRHVGEAEEDPKVLPAASVEAWGAVIARIHEVGLKRPALHRPRFTPSTAVDLAELVVESPLLPDDLRERYLDDARRIATVLERATDGVPVHRIHGDMGVNNLMWSPSGPIVLDFDDFEVGPAIADIFLATTAYHVEGFAEVPWKVTDAASLKARMDGVQPALAALLRGYRSVRPFDERWLGAWLPLQLLRGLYFDAWYCARWHDPLFQRELAEEGFPSRTWWEEDRVFRAVLLEAAESGGYGVTQSTFSER